MQLRSKVKLNKKRALIMAGGTGGHVIPGLEIANELKKQGYEVAWLGTKWGIENNLVPKYGFHIFYLPVWGIRGKKLIYKLMAPFRVMAAIFYSMYIILNFKPSFVLGMGGFASGPGGVAAWLLRKPLIIHEQNAILGFTNKILAYFSKKTLVSFPKEITNIKELGHQKFIFTGNPVRAEIISLANPHERWQKRVGSLRVLVLGGSQGALVLNNIVPKAIMQLPVSQRPDIWHQSGKRLYEFTHENYSKLGLKAKVDAFIDDMAEAYAWADLVIARSGALTVAELAAAGLPALLVPYPYATDNHQKKNADYLVKNNAAIMLEQDDITVDSMAEILLDLINARPKLLEMANCARKLSIADATHNIIRHCQEVSLDATY